MQADVAAWLRSVTVDESSGWSHRRSSIRRTMRPPPSAPPCRRARARSCARRARGRQALLARRSAGAGGAASIRARAPLRGDGADVLPADGRRSDEHRGLPGLVRPDHARPPRHPRACVERVRHGRRGGPRQPAQDRRSCRSTSGSRIIRAASAPTCPMTRIEVSVVRRPDGRVRRASVARRPSSAACAPSATSRPRCSSPTTTGCWRRRSTRSSS